MRKRRALIIGGSLGGLFAAHQLQSIGWDVDVFERTSDDLADRGAGLGTHPVLFEIMQRVGLCLDESGSTAPKSYVCIDRDNRTVHEMPMRRRMTAWSRLYRPLKEHLPPGSYHSGKLLERLETDANAVTAIFADGSRAISIPPPLIRLDVVAGMKVDANVLLARCMLSQTLTGALKVFTAASAERLQSGPGWKARAR